MKACMPLPTRMAPTHQGALVICVPWLAAQQNVQMMTRPPCDVQNVLDDFVCALQKKVLLQGRMYIFESHVCFHSSVFGYIVDKVINLKVR